MTDYGKNQKKVYNDTYVLYATILWVTYKRTHIIFKIIYYLYISIYKYIDTVYMYATYTYDT